MALEDSVSLGLRDQKQYWLRELLKPSDVRHLSFSRRM